jgi:GDP/UDP-N,N'-diacetylbacillosamine 2-epimerase (hydrolysing)
MKLSMKRKICVVTGSRAEYGLLRNISKLIKLEPTMQLQIIATGSHLTEKFGSTYKEILQDGLNIDFKIDILSEVINEQTTSIAMGKVQAGVSKILQETKPDLLLVVGDRYEILSAVIAALLCKIPVAHIHGGEVTIGAFDDSIRHAITKMSHLHFVATEKSKKRVIQLGEKPETIFNFGGLGVDAIQSNEFISKEEIQKLIRMNFGEKNLLVTYHPETMSRKSPSEQISILLDALAKKNEINFIFTGVNADPGSDEITDEIKKFVESRSNAIYCSSLGQRNYLSTILYCDGVVGNSSSGILEVPTFKKATINIGNRQLGREMAESVINCELESSLIAKSIDKIYSTDFKVILSKVSNPYGRGGASSRIFEEIKKFDFSNLVMKSFHDL